MMARLMSHFRPRGIRLNVLVATSGDTGSAVGEAFRDVEGVDVYILYPQGEVSGRQKKQLDTIGGN
ncbi:MAG: threonine synthase, partial [Syntrophobacterales bacterium CG_4_9_14_3_um_filter_49_8]